MINAIELHNFSKHFDAVKAVEGVHLTVRQGEIYGFLGRNGAGKTTTIRALLGMIHPTAGTVQILGQPLGRDGRGPWSKVGYLVEGASAYPELTVTENLEIASRLHHIRTQQVVGRVIEQLGLAAYANKKAGTLSTGNLQRLGLARALLHSPELLILDEPANGLDPAGMVEIRELLRGLAREGITVFMSSHNLSEIDKLATRIGIIHKGHLLEELDGSGIEQIRSRRLVVSARDLAAAKAAILDAGYQSVTVAGDSIVMEELRAIDGPDEVARILVNAGAPPTRLFVEQESLEDYFLRLTGENS